MSEFDREKWNGKYRGDLAAWKTPSKVVTSLRSFFPTSGTAIDVAGGAGRHAIWLAGLGLDVTVADVSPIGLSIAKEESQRCEWNIDTLEIDLEEQPFPSGPWDVIFSHHFLWRPLFNVIPSFLRLGGRLIVVQPTVINLERNERPPRQFLVEKGELQVLASKLKLVHYEEGWLVEGRHEAVVVAEK